jgi:hypothetical protein
MSIYFAKQSVYLLVVGLLVVLSSSVIESFSFIDRRHISIPRLHSGCNTMQYGYKESDEEIADVYDKSRRQSILVSIFSWLSLKEVSFADDNLTANRIISGTVVLPDMLLPIENKNEGVDDSNSSKSPTPALYITARPNVPDNVPKAVLDGSRGKPPPILAARYENPDFPFHFTLSEKDLTLEGVAGATSDADSNIITNAWWTDDDLIISARYDSDGVAATRSPDDKVGRTLWKRSSNTNDTGVQINLTGRGAFGKFATKKN